MKAVWGWMGMTENEANWRAKTEEKCIVDGCNRAFHLGYCLCKEHYSEFKEKDE